MGLVVTLVSSFTRNKKPLVERWRGAVRPGRRWGNPRAPAGRGPISGWKPGPPSLVGPCKQQAPGDGVRPGAPWKPGQHAAGVWGAVTPVSWGLLLRSAVSPETRSTVQRSQFPLCRDRTALIRVEARRVTVPEMGGRFLHPWGSRATFPECSASRGPDTGPGWGARGGGLGAGGGVSGSWGAGDRGLEAGLLSLEGRLHWNLPVRAAPKTKLPLK